MTDKIMMRRHIITLTPDVIYLLLTFSLLIEVHYLGAGQRSMLSGLCEMAAAFFFFWALLDLLNWMSYHVIIERDCVTVRQFWFFSRCCRGQGDLKIIIQLRQNAWDALFDKGTMEVYAPDGEDCTLGNLAGFSRLSGVHEMARG